MAIIPIFVLLLIEMLVSLELLLHRGKKLFVKDV